MTSENFSLINENNKSFALFKKIHAKTTNSVYGVNMTATNSPYIVGSTTSPIVAAY
jgi:hypothetical protein